MFRYQFLTGCSGSSTCTCYQKQIMRMHSSCCVTWPMKGNGHKGHLVLTQTLVLFQCKSAFIHFPKPVATTGGMDSGH